MELNNLEITLAHPNGETRLVPVESILRQGRTLVVRWGQAGLYELDLDFNRLQALSAAARRKHPLNMWKAEDIALVRKTVRNILNRNTNGEAQLSDMRHAETMPKAR